MKKTLTLATGILLGLFISMGVSAKTLRMAYDADPISLDPHEQLSGGMLQLSHMIFDPFVRWNSEMQFDSRLAESWKRLDKHTVRFNLRKGVKFHSGNDFTADDVAWTFNRLKESADYKGLFQPFKELKIIDDYTIDLVTNDPYPLVLHMATYIFPMDSKFYSGTDATGQPKDAVVKIGPSFALHNSSGTGAFKVVEWEQGARYVFERFADYWDKDSPGNVSKIVLTPIKEEATRVAVPVK